MGKMTILYNVIYLLKYSVNVMELRPCKFGRNPVVCVLLCRSLHFHYITCPIVRSTPV